MTSVLSDLKNQIKSAPAKVVLPKIETKTVSPSTPLPVVDTEIDAFCNLLSQIENKTLAMDDLAHRTGLSFERLEVLGKILHEQGLIELIYPTNVMSRPHVRLLKPLESASPKPVEGKEVESYSTVSDGVASEIRIREVAAENRPVYELQAPAIGPYTEAFLEFLRDELARSVPVQTEEISDPNRVSNLKSRFLAAAIELLNNQFPELPPVKKTILAGTLLHRIYGLGVLELLMADDKLEEIAVNGSSYPVSVYHRKLGWLKTNVQLPSEEEIYNYASQIGRKSGRNITLLEPIMDAHLISGDRVSASLFPISATGNSITIRRFARNPWTLIDFIDPKVHTLSSDMAALLWLCVQYEMNLLVAGGTASGKTSLLNTLCALSPPHHRIITIEDTRELNLPEFLRWNWVALTTRGPSPEGRGEVSMLDLMVSSLRMRPDKIIVGEIRRQREAEVLFEAMHTGHAVYSTIHADTANQVMRRLTQPPISIPPIELESLHLILVQFRDRRTGFRRSYELAEVEPSASELKLNRLYRWHARDDTFEKKDEGTRLFSELNLHTGMTLDEIKDELASRKQILEWMVSQGLHTPEAVGNVMSLFYRSPDEVIKASQKKKPLGGV